MKTFWRWLTRPLPGPDAFLKELRMATVGDFSKADVYRDYRAVFQTEQGKRVLWHLISIAHVYDDITERATDSHQAYFKDGRRSLVLEIFRFMNMQPSEDKEIRNITKD